MFNELFSFFFVHKRVPCCLVTGFIIAITHILRKVEKPKGTGIDAHLFCFVFCAEYPLWTFVNASIINLILITLERYLCVVSPVYHKNVFSQSKNIILRLGVIWVLAPICKYRFSILLVAVFQDKL